MPMLQRGSVRREPCEGQTLQRLNHRRFAYTFRRDFPLAFSRSDPAARASARRMTIRSALFWIAAACCVLAEVAILRSLLFGRAREAERAHARDSSPVARSPRPVEIAWALLPAVGLLFVLYLTWRAVDARQAPRADVTRVGAAIGA